MNNQLTDIILQLRELDLTVHVEKEELVICGEVASLPDTLLQDIRQNKAAIIKYLHRNETGSMIPTTPVTGEGKSSLPASAAQKRLWILSQFGNASVAYTITCGFIFSGELHPDKIQNAVNTVVQRHESLRTVFRMIDGELQQVILSQVTIPVCMEDISGLLPEKQKKHIAQKFIENKSTLFNLEKGPLLRINFYRLNSEEHVCMVSMHHVISDGWSFGVLLKEVISYYSRELSHHNAPVTGNVLQYSQYSLWQSDKAGRDETLYLSFWKQYVPAQPISFELPLNFPRPGTRSFEGNTIRTYSQVGLFNDVSRFCREHGTTPFIFFRTALAVLLAKITGADCIPIGVPVAGRSHHELETAIGLYVNTLPLFSHIKPDQPFLNFLEETAADTKRVLASQDVSFDKIINGLGITVDRSRNPLFDVMMVFNDLEVGREFTIEAAKAGLAVKSAETWLYALNDHEIKNTGSQMDLSFIFGFEPGEIFYIDVEYCSALFDSETIRYFLLYFDFIIVQVLAHPGILLKDIKTAPPSITRLILEQFNNTNRAFANDTTVVELFEKTAMTTPEAVALTGERYVWTYRQLNERVNRFSGFIKEKYAVTPGIPVALKMDRGEWMIVSILAILKSGAAYVPVGPDYPEERIDYILSNSGSHILIDENTIAAFSAVMDEYSDANPERMHTPDDLAYIIYTSGSTGLPKGCMIAHRGLVNRLEWMWNELGCNDTDVILQKTSFTFDVSVWELLMAFCYGGSIVLASAEDVISPERLVKLVEKHQVTCIHFVPSAMNAFIAHGFQNSTPATMLRSLRRVVLSGEALNADLVQKWYRLTDIPMINLYGPTEATIDVTYYHVTKNDSIIPIGKPIWNTQVYILDEAMQLVAPGITGEIWLGGIGLAKGYIRNEKLTAERFISNPLIKGEKLYKTGDLGRWLPDGNIEYLGRKDDQVKIRGFRVEMGEIENVLRRHPLINDAAVIAKSQKNDEKELVAFIASNTQLSSSGIRDFLLAKLPSFMLPQHYVQLDVLPLNKSGKTDKQALKQYEYKSLDTGNEFAEPVSATEKKMAMLWCEVLRKESIGVNDNFFEIGGNSMNALDLVSVIRRKMDIEIPVVKIFQYPTIALLAGYISSGGEDMTKAEDEISFRHLDVMEHTLNLIRNDE